MIVLTATQEQYNNLNGYTNGPNKLLFAKDGLDRWIVGTGVLGYPAFSEIYTQLEELERVEYAPFPPEE
jgi:hypothetical protein